jgi:oleate hydratase
MSIKRSPMPEGRTDNNAHVYLVGGGIASLAAAAFFIRDVDIPGHNITILEELGKIGGSLDAAGAPKDGYIMRGGRMIESKYLCSTPAPAFLIVLREEVHKQPGLP